MPVVPFFFGGVLMGTHDGGVLPEESVRLASSLCLLL